MLFCNYANGAGSEEWVQDYAGAVGGVALASGGKVDGFGFYYWAQLDVFAVLLAGPFSVSVHLLRRSAGLP